MANGVVLSSHAVLRSATTTVSAAILSVNGATNLHVTNLDPTNYVLIGFGSTAALAQANAANGIPVRANSEKDMGIPPGMPYYAYKAGGGTGINIHIAEGF